MNNKLIIVESPSKARTIQNILGKDYKVVASMGHVRDLPSKTIGLNPNNNFKPDYKIIPDKKKVLENIKSEITNNTQIFLATDDDREGESISWHLVSALNLSKSKIKRIIFHEITPEAIHNALKTPKQINQNIVDAQQARRIVDRIVGYNLSPILWKNIKPGLSAGRVQSIALRLLSEREKEIIEFKPEEYWKIILDFRASD